MLGIMCLARAGGIARAVSIQHAYPPKEDNVWGYDARGEGILINQSMFLFFVLEEHDPSLLYKPASFINPSQNLKQDNLKNQKAVGEDFIMFDLSLTLQLPPSSLQSPQFISSFKTTLQLITLPFALEERSDYASALKAHRNAITLLEKIQKVAGIRKFNRKMYERQTAVHKERVDYLEGLESSGFAGVVRVPSRGWMTTSKPTTATESSTPLSTLSTSNTPREYTLTHDSELVDVGVRSIWQLIKDPATGHTHYAAQALWDKDKPLVECVLRRADGFFPFGEAIHTTIVKQGNPGLNYRLRMQRRGVKDGEGDRDVWEVPATSCGKKEWSPRRFTFGGRHFVWRNEEGKDGSLFSKKWAWETLYETAGEAEGSETVGTKLAWGNTEGTWKAKSTLYMLEGLDLALREHILASQLSRFLRWSYPPDKDLSGLEAGARAGMAVGSLISIAEYFS